MKSQLSQITRKAQGSLAVRDVSTLVKPSQVVDTEHLTTLFVVISKFAVQEFDASYERMCQYIVGGAHRLWNSSNSSMAVQAATVHRGTCQRGPTRQRDLSHQRGQSRGTQWLYSSHNQPRSLRGKPLLQYTWSARQLPLSALCCRRTDINTWLSRVHPMPPAPCSSCCLPPVTTLSQPPAAGSPLLPGGCGGQRLRRGARGAVQARGGRLQGGGAQQGVPGGAPWGGRGGGQEQGVSGGGGKGREVWGGGGWGPGIEAGKGPRWAASSTRH